LGKNEDFFVALWIFRPKTAIFAMVGARFPAVLLYFSRNSVDLAYFRAIVAAIFGGVHHFLSAQEKVCRTKPDRWSSAMFGKISSHDTKFM